MDGWLELRCGTSDPGCVFGMFFSTGEVCNLTVLGWSMGRRRMELVPRGRLMASSRLIASSRLGARMGSRDVVTPTGGGMRFLRNTRMRRTRKVRHVVYLLRDALHARRKGSLVTLVWNENTVVRSLMTFRCFNSVPQRKHHRAREDTNAYIQLFIFYISTEVCKAVAHRARTKNADF